MHSLPLLIFCHQGYSLLSRIVPHISNNSVYIENNAWWPTSSQWSDSGSKSTIPQSKFVQIVYHGLGGPGAPTTRRFADPTQGPSPQSPKYTPTQFHGAPETSGPPVALPSWLQLEAQNRAEQRGRIKKSKQEQAEEDRKTVEGRATRSQRGRREQEEEEERVANQVLLAKEGGGIELDHEECLAQQDDFDRQDNLLNVSGEEELILNTWKSANARAQQAAGAGRRVQQRPQAGRNSAQPGGQAPALVQQRQPQTPHQPQLPRESQGQQQQQGPIQTPQNTIQRPSPLPCNEES
jgi:hypothetical protein